MARLSTCKESALEQETLAALEPVRMRGQLAEVYLQFANSEPALRAYLQMEQALQAGNLSASETECIKLLVSELTQCSYCLSIHTFKSTNAGLSADIQSAIRLGEPLLDERLDVISKLVRSLCKNPGVISDGLLGSARNAGLTDAELVDICMATSTIFFTNIVNHLNDSQSPLAPAPTLVRQT